MHTFFSFIFTTSSLVSVTSFYKAVEPKKKKKKGEDIIISLMMLNIYLIMSYFGYQIS